MPVATKRAYDPPSARDGYRVLVDGLWPRGLTKERLKVAAWMREIAPSAELRTWYGHRPEKWDEFRKRYHQELRDPARRVLLQQLIELARKEKVTLVSAARDAERCNATVIAEIIARGKFDPGSGHAHCELTGNLLPSDTSAMS